MILCLPLTRALHCSSSIKSKSPFATSPPPFSLQNSPPSSPTYFCSAPVLNHSRAYLNFKDPSDVFRFKAAFNGKNFITDKTGQQYRCVVEYAPYQRLARRKGRHDNKENTVEKDEDYREFVARLEAGPELLPSAEVQLQQKEAATAVGDGGTAGPTQTALMQYLKEKRAKKISRKILREPSAKAKGKSSGGAGAVGGDGGQSKKAKQRESRRERNSGNGPYGGGGGDEGKEKERKKEKRSRKDKLKEKKTAAAAKTAGGGGGGEQPQAAPAVRILQRPGTSAPAASVGPSSSRPQPGLAATAAATKPPRKLVPVPITRPSPRAGGGPPSSAAAATAASAAGGGGGESNTTKSDATGRDNSSKRGRTKRGAGRGGGRGEAAAAGGREDGGGGGGSNRGSGRGGRGGKGARGSGRGSNSTAPMGNTSSTASASQPKIVPIVIARKPKPQPAAPAGGGGGGGAS